MGQGDQGVIYIYPNCGKGDENLTDGWGWRSRGWEIRRNTKEEYSKPLPLPHLHLDR